MSQFVTPDDPKFAKAYLTPILSLKRLESVSVKIGKMYKIGIGIGMLFFRNKKLVSV